MSATDEDLILASTSPYRRRLLERLEIPFSCVAPEVDETPLPHETAEALATRLAQEKARVVSERFPGQPVLGSDQTARVGAELLSKPGTMQAARTQLAACSARTITFFTGVALCVDGTLRDTRCCETRVRFRELPAEEIKSYLERDRPLDCAGSFRWEGIGICLFEALSSEDPTALEGLPLITVASMLRRIGINPLLTSA